MSLNPAIGKSFYEKFPDSFFPHDTARLPDGRTTSVPTYYRNLLKVSDPQLYEQLKLSRIEKCKENPNNTPERLAVRHANKAKITKEQLPRDYL